MLETYEKNSKKKLAATFLVILVIAGMVVLADFFKNTSKATTDTVVRTSPAVSSDITSTTAATPATNPSAYKDGTYTATSDYYVPHGSESIAVSLTVRNGVITTASIQNSESNRDSAQYQEDFASVYKSYVVGKKISGLQLDVIAGASDTAQGFNDALAQIAVKAQA